MTPIIQAVTLPNQVMLPYVEQGDPAGIPVVLLHGYTDSWRSFASVLPHLPVSLHVFALSQRGHGNAARPTTGYRPQDFVADLVAFLETLQLGPAVIVGHSMGSYIAQRFAVDHPERTLGLVLIDTCTTLRGNPVVEELQDTVSQLTDPIDPGFVRAFQQSTLARSVPPTFLDTVVQESLKVPARVWKAVLAALLEADASAERSRIKVPTLVVWGAQDALFPHSEQEALAAAITGAQRAVYADAGHAPHWEEPARFAADLVAFTEQLRSTAGTRLALASAEM